MPESAAEKIERMAVKEREIVHRNTRFVVDPFNQEKSKETITQAASFQAMMLQGKVGADGKDILPTQSPHVAGYGFVATPSPAPGRGQRCFLCDRRDECFCVVDSLMWRLNIYERLISE